MSMLNQSGPLGEAQWIWIAKIAGAVSGSAISLAYMLPKGRREAAMRFAVGILCGMIFGGAAGVKISEQLSLGKSLSSAELMLMGSAAASFAAWTALGFFKRFTDRIKTTGTVLPEHGHKRPNADDK